MKFLKRLMLVLRYKGELEELLKQMSMEREIEKRKEQSEYLNLCKRHQQRDIGSHYAEHNCDYCKALKGTTK
jgi:hypothetical protein